MFAVPLHLLFVHFPIALALVSAIVDVRAHLAKRPELHRIGAHLNLWAAAGAALAMITGLQLLGDRSQASRATIHAALGLVSGLSLITAAMARYSAQARESDGAKPGVEPWLILEVLAAVVVIVTAITGHRLVLAAVK